MASEMRRNESDGSGEASTRDSRRDGLNMNWLDEIEEARKRVTIEKQREFLSYIHAGMTLGDAYRKAEISFDAANGIMRHNIETASYLRTEPKP